VQVKHTIRTAVHAAAAFAVAALVVGSLGTAFAAPNPHVPDGNKSTDSCAMCHRAHTANTTIPGRKLGATETVGTSLLLTPDPTRGDVSLCLLCHGVGQLGSNSDVETAFLRASVHSLAPTSSPYGPDPMVCSSCHDSHGKDRTSGGLTWPALLRSFSLDSTTPVFTGEEYCATCHTVQTGERWAGLDVYKRTGHFIGFPMPATGTGIRCSICHDPHGSNVAPLLASAIASPSVASTFTVTADDRTFCTACHSVAKDTWPSPATYASSGQGSSSATVAISARWVPADGGRLVGECQVCHAPMGHDDGEGGAIPKLLDAKGRVLCDRCHSDGGVAPESMETSSQARPISGALTLAAVYAPDNGTTSGTVSLYGTATVSAPALAGPRQYVPAAGSGPAAAGDVDGDGKPELVVASATQALLTVYQTDPLNGLSSQPTTYAIPATAAAIAVADILDPDPLLFESYAEIAIVDVTGSLSVYDVSHTSLLRVAGPFTLSSAGPWAMATGNVASTALPDLVVTDENGGSGGTVSLLADNGTHGSTFTTLVTGGAPTAPSVGEILSAHEGNEIVVCDAVAATDNVAILDGAGAPLASYTMGAGDGVPTASAVGDVLWAAPNPGKNELAVAFTNAGGDSKVLVTPQSAPGDGLMLLETITETTGAGYHTGSLLVRDVDGDTRAELVAGNGGTWNVLGTLAVAPSVQVWHSDGTDLQAPHTYVGGGTDLAGAAPSLALADFGPVFPSRHPIDEAPVSHVSTETAPFGRHVTCSDCHNVHEATTATAIAPLVPGPLRGAWGVAVTFPGSGSPDFAAHTARATDSYEICLKCHSSFTALGGRSDIATQTAPTNVSVHAIVQSADASIAAETFVDGWTQDSILTCTDCHGDAAGATAAQKRELHQSPNAPILVKPYGGAAAADPNTLCYQCHKYSVYATGVDDAPGVSAFVSPLGDKLHSTHVAAASPAGHGLACSACHVAHGSKDNPALLRDDIGLVTAGSGSGSCTNACHGGATQVWNVAQL
jgi:predicted CXXCH cytochrome family protein